MWKICVNSLSHTIGLRDVQIVRGPLQLQTEPLSDVCRYLPKRAQDMLRLLIDLFGMLSAL